MDNEWTLVEHLSELRRRVVYSLILVVLFFILSLVFVHQIFSVLEAPLGHVKLAVLGPGDVIQIYFMIAGFGSLGMSLPFILYQLWKFIQPALSPKESRAAMTMFPFAFLMFLGGVAFSYFVVFPIVLHFLLQLSFENFIVVMTAHRYFSFLVNLTLPFGLIFEMPIALLFLTRIHVVTPRMLSKMRKYAYFAIIVFASLISPPELVSHLSVATPMMALYEISIMLCRLQARRMAKNINISNSSSVVSKNIQGI